MEKREAFDGGTPLPEPIIQHIQSFLSRKEAAQTTIFSKSWYSAWSTRSNLYIDQSDFRDLSDGDAKFRITDDEFWEFVKKTMRRYEESRLKIESFRLCIRSNESERDLLAYEFIVKAMKSGATDIDFEFLVPTMTFVLPHEVLRSENLIRLSVAGCKIDLGADLKVSCWKLKFLSLSRVYFEADLFWHILWKFPMVEKLLLSKCECLLGVETNRARMLELRPSIESIVDGPINLNEFHKLKCLLLEMVNIDPLFFSDFSSNFPCLKDLSIRACTGCKSIQICSPVLEYISISRMRWLLRANFDVPNIRRFTFAGLNTPFLSFETAGREWESDISLKSSHPGNPWFYTLNRFLKNISHSKISLSLKIGCFLGNNFGYVGQIQGISKPIVENLMLSIHDPCAALLDGLFSSFCPKSIYPLDDSSVGLEGKVLLELLCTELVHEVSENVYIPNRNTSVLHDLEEVNVQFFDENDAEWRPLSWKTLLANMEKKQKLCFQLRWG